MKEWQKVVAEMYWMFMYKIYAKVAAMDVMRQGLRLYQHRAAPIQLLEYQMVRALCRFDTLGNLVSSHRPTSDMYPPQFCGGSQSPGG